MTITASGGNYTIDISATLQDERKYKLNFSGPPPLAESK
jgi:hypothetical protein